MLNTPATPGRDSLTPGPAGLKLPTTLDGVEITRDAITAKPQMRRSARTVLRRTDKNKLPFTGSSGRSGGVSPPVLTCWKGAVDPAALLREPQPFPHKLVKAGQVAGFMSPLQCQLGLFAIPLRSRQHANRTYQNQSGSRNEPDSGCPSVAGFRAGALKQMNSAGTQTQGLDPRWTLKTSGTPSITGKRSRRWCGVLVMR